MDVGVQETGDTIEMLQRYGFRGRSIASTEWLPWELFTNLSPEELNRDN